MSASALPLRDRWQLQMELGNIQGLLKRKDTLGRVGKTARMKLALIN
jgi:hypothetical protein